MIAEPQLIRDELVSQFWNDVRATLINNHQRNTNQAVMGIDQYRSDTERLGLRDVVYNQGVERTAEIVDGVIENGLPVQKARTNGRSTDHSKS